MTIMDASLHRDITKRLENDYAFKARPGSKWLQEGKCPACSKKEVWASAESPWKLWCGRKSKCGWEGYVKEIYDDLFQSWSDRYPQTTESPMAAADAYLVNMRGFEIGRLKGCYTQEYYHSRDLNIGSATVRFDLPGCGYWERIIDRPHRFGKMKAHFQYGKSYRGKAWVPPVTLIDVLAADEIWITEGIFDAIALCLNGIAAISAISNSNYPKHTLEKLFPAGGKRPKLVWAPDGDRGGLEYLEDHVKQSRTDGWHATAAIIPQPLDGKKIDWNEAHQRNRLDDDHLTDYRHEGNVALAPSPSEKARRMYKRNEKTSFPLEFGDSVYWFELSEKRLEKAKQSLREKDGEERSDDDLTDEALKQACSVTEIASCLPEPLYFQRNAITDDSQYFFNIKMAKKRPVKSAFTAEQVATPAQFDIRLLSLLSGARWKGSKEKLSRTYDDRLRKLKEVDTIDFIGYTREFNAYVFQNVAIREGRVFEVNEEEYFELDKKTNVKTTSSVPHSINADPASFNQAWPRLVRDVYGGKGLVALAFWFGSLFAEQVRACQESFPFFEMVGEAGSGKTSLVTFLNRLTGRPTYEGFDPSKSTAAGRARTFVQVANLPVVLMEGDRGDDGAKALKFDYNELKSLYNGRSTRTTGVKNSGNETYEPPFRGSIVIEQNRPVKADDAVMQRICHVFMTREGHSPEGKQKSDRLNAMTAEELSYFVVGAAKAEAQVMERFQARMPVYEAELMALEKVKSIRLAKNHAQLMAMAEAMEIVVPSMAELRSETYDQIKRMIVEREEVIGSDHPIVRNFWDRFYELDGTGLHPYLNHSAEKGQIAVNLNEWLARAAERWRDVPTLSELHEHLPTSKVHKFVEANKTVRSPLRSKGLTEATDGPKASSVRCWIFKRPSSE